VPQQFSKQTQELLTRADRAIDRSVQLREQRRKYLARAEQRLFQLELSLYRRRARELGAKAEK
jgi:hypothetical protein